MRRVRFGRAGSSASAGTSSEVAAVVDSGVTFSTFLRRVTVRRFATGCSSSAASTGTTTGVSDSSVLRRRTTLRLGLSASCAVTSATGSAAGGSASTLALRVRVARGFLAGAASTPSASVWTVRRRTTRFFGSAGSSDGVSIWLSSRVVVITLTVLLSFSLFGFGSFLWPVGYALCAFCSFVFLFGRLVAEHQFKFFALRHIAR